MTINVISTAELFAPVKTELAAVLAAAVETRDIYPKLFQRQHRPRRLLQTHLCQDGGAFRPLDRGRRILGEANQASLTALREFGHQAGLAFQIVDDVLDFIGNPNQFGKPVSGDLHQGLLTLPAIHYAQAQAEAFVSCLEVGTDFTDHVHLPACARQVDKDCPRGR